MKNYPDYISEKRRPVQAPDAIVENGEVHFGTFDQPFKKLNLLDLKNPCRTKIPEFLKASRLTAWEAFEIHFDEFALISAVYNVGTLAGFSIFMLYDKATEKAYKWMNLVAPAKKAKVASQLIDDDCYIKTKNSEYRITNDFLNGKACAKGFSSGRHGKIEVDVRFERLAPPANGVMPLSYAKDGKTFKNALYSEKDFFKASGTVTVNGKKYESNERSVGIIDDHKGYYPVPAHYDWITTMGVCAIDGEMKYLAFNLTRNQSVDQHNYNENVLWLEGWSCPLPPVKFTHENGKRKAKTWYIKDEFGCVDIKFEIKSVVYNNIPIVSYYALPFGTISGFVKDINGKKYVLDGMLGIGEDKTSRL